MSVESFCLCYSPYLHSTIHIHPQTTNVPSMRYQPQRFTVCTARRPYPKLLLRIFGIFICSAKGTISRFAQGSQLWNCMAISRKPFCHLFRIPLLRSH